MYHYIRDCDVPTSADADNGGYGEAGYLIYHFLRTAGWSWIWECDGDEDNHCADASMEASGTTDWTAVGTASLAKSTSSQHMQLQSLEVDSAATNDGVQTAALLTMTASVTYRVTIWAANSTASAWQVQADDGGGSFASIGTIPANSGVWTQYDFSFTTDSSANSRYLRVVDNNGTTGTIYLDSFNVRRSWYEYNGVDAEDLSGSPDGQILNSNEFSSASYSFVAGDVGKYVCVWDTTNLGNSGAYEITSISGTNAVLDLRAGGTPALTAQTGLRWRMCDTSVAPRIYDPGVTSEQYAGWGLESPHTEKWRFFCRNWWTTNNDLSLLSTWSAPYDADFDVETGNFIGSENSHPIYGYYTKGNLGGAGLGGEIAAPTNTSVRVYLMTDDNNTALWIMLRPADGGNPNFEGLVFAGFSGADTYHTLRQSFIHYGRPNFTTSVDRGCCSWNDPSYTSFSYGAQCGFGGNGVMIDSKIPILGIGSGDVTGKEFVGRVNPFDGNRYLRKMPIIRDYFGYNGQHSEKTLDTLGIMVSDVIVGDSIYTGVESNTYMYIREGVYLELPSSGGVGLFEPLT